MNTPLFLRFLFLLQLTDSKPNLDKSKECYQATEAQKYRNHQVQYMYVEQNTETVDKKNQGIKRKYTGQSP